MKDRVRSLVVCPAFLTVLFSCDTAVAGKCEGLISLKLPQITISTAQTVQPGSFTTPTGQVINSLPGFCRVVAFATPTPQSHINFEVWLPINSWNKRFRGEGSGGSLGSIGYSAMANGLQHLYTTMANDNGHTGSDWSFAQPPERVVDFGGSAATEEAREALRRELNRCERIFDFVRDAAGNLLPRGGFLRAEHFGEVVEHENESGVGAARA